VKFQLHQGSYRHLIDTVIKGDIDLALLGPVPESDRRIKGHILFPENLVALLPARHPLSEEASLKLRQLKEDTFVLFPKGFVLRDMVDNACQSAGFEPRVSFEGEDIDAIRGLVAAGLGVSLVPEITLIDNVPRTTMRVAVSEPSVTRTVGVITPADRDLLPTERLFFEFLKHFFAVSRGMSPQFGA
jgi:LysR family transcriptional activator of glutamate synthase operon